MKYIFLVIMLLMFKFNYAQQIQKPVSWTIEYRALPDMAGELIFKAKIDPKWHIYSQRLTDAGPIPTSFTITPLKDVFELSGSVEEGNAHEEFVAAFDAKLYVFEGEAIFTQKIIRKTKTPFTIKTSLEYMTCNDSQCLPPTTVDLEVAVPAIVLKSKL